MLGFGPFGEYAFGDAEDVSATPVFQDSWNQPLSQPTRFRVLPAALVAVIAWSGIVIGDLTQPETVTADRWFRSLSEPVRFRAALPAGQQQFAAFVKAELFEEAITADRWVPPLAEPVRFRKSLPAGQQQFAAFVKAAPFQEAITADRWVPPLAEPVRFPRRLGTSAQKFLSWSEWPLVSGEYWHQPLSHPNAVHVAQRLSAPNQQFLAFVKGEPFPEDVTEAAFHQPLGEPVRFRPSLRTAQQQFAAFVKAEPFEEAVTADRWVPPLAEPVRFRKSLPAGQQQFAAFVKAAPFQEAITADRWVPPLAEPVRFRKALPSKLHPFLHWSEWPVALEEGVSTLTGVAIINAVASSLVTELLHDQRARLVYKVEIHPGRNSDRPDI